MKTPNSVDSIANIIPGCPFHQGVGKLKKDLQATADKDRDVGTLNLPDADLAKKVELSAIAAASFEEIWSYANEHGMIGIITDDLARGRFGEVILKFRTDREAVHHLTEAYRNTLEMDEKSLFDESDRSKKWSRRILLIDGEPTESPTGRARMQKASFLDFFNFIEDIVLVVPEIFEEQFKRPITKPEFEKILNSESLPKIMTDFMQNEKKIANEVYMRMRRKEDDGSISLMSSYFEFDNLEALNLRIRPEVISNIRKDIEGSIGETRSLIRLNCPMVYAYKAFREMSHYFFSRLKHDYLQLYYFRTGR